MVCGLGEDFTLGVADVPDESEPAATGRNLPAEIMRQVCGQLDTLTSPVMRTAIELIIDTGSGNDRRPGRGRCRHPRPTSPGPRLTSSR